MCIRDRKSCVCLKRGGLKGRIAGHFMENFLILGRVDDYALLSERDSAREYRKCKNS